MNLPIQFKCIAKAEFDEAVDWYELRRSGLGAKFARAVLEVLERISSVPLIRSKLDATFAFRVQQLNRSRLKETPMRPLVLFSTLGLTLLTLCSTAHAQLNPLETKGKVVELRPNLIVMQVEGGDTWLVNLDPNRVEDGVRYEGLPAINLEVNGTETADMLRPGMIVRFEADVERKKTIKDAVSEVTLLGPGKNNTFGLLPAVGGDGPKDGAAERMMIVGQLTAASRSNITVALPENKSIKARLDPAAVVKIASSDYQLARPGDEIELKGGYLKAPRVFAMNVKITRVAKPEKPGRKPATSSKKPDATGKKPVAEPAPPSDFGAGDPRDAKPVESAAPVKIIPGKILKVN